MCNKFLHIIILALNLWNDLKPKAILLITLIVPKKSGDVAGTLVHYFTVYLNEPTPETDQNAQMGGTYTGELVYTTTTGGNILTGEFTIGE